MAAEGWIKLHRQLCNHELWLAEPFTRGQAWVDLLLLANHKDGFIRVRGNKMAVGRGQVGWSQSSLAKRWKWSRKKVSSFLSELEKMEHQIEQQKNNVTSIITIVNYELYQQKEPQEEQQKNRRRTAEEPQRNTNKNVKNDKNEKKKDQYTPEFLSFWEAYPRSENKNQTFVNWNTCLKSYTIEQLMTACENYKTAKKGTETTYLKNSSNFLGKEKVFMDYLEGQPGKQDATQSTLNWYGGNNDSNS